MSTTTPPTSSDTIVGYLTDLYALLNHGLGAIERQGGSLQHKNHPDALEAVKAFDATLRTQMAAIDARVKVLGGSVVQPLKEAVTAATGFVAGIMNIVRPEEAARSLRDDHAFLNLAAISAMMLHTTSLSLGDTETAALAETAYRAFAKLVQRINHTLPHVVLEELRQNGLPAQDITADCHRLMRDAWKGDDEGGEK